MSTLTYHIVETMISYTNDTICCTYDIICVSQCMISHMMDIKSKVRNHDIIVSTYDIIHL